ncbi:hypothetical protein [Pseudoalteromonas porphyrae]|uniref:hypothetical protein n=1 Tax=Pseudoalteromonas porphyrae TaxID=187330 RepID=UPI000A8EC12B|nr:hypothetical protein [Pseudoalteromonas porphyrae]
MRKINPRLRIANDPVGRHLWRQWLLYHRETKVKHHLFLLCELSVLCGELVT